MIAALINFVVYLVVIGLIFWLLLYIIDTVPLFAPFQQVARIVLTVIGCLILIYFLLGIVGLADGPRLPRLI